MQTNVPTNSSPSALLRIRSALMLVLALAFVGFAPAQPPRALAANPVFVSPITPNGWGFAQEVANGTGSFVAGPATPPLGSGSARMTLDANGRELFGTSAYAGTLLSRLDSLEYSTYRSSDDAGNNLAISLQLDIDYNMTDATTAWQGRMIYEPYHTAGVGGTVTPNTWRTWNPLATGAKWWASGAPGNTNCPQAMPCTWAQVLAYWPNAGIRNAGPGTGFVVFKAGGPWANFDGNVDAFTVGVDGRDTTYDFEYEAQCTTICYVNAGTGDDSYGGASPSRAKKTIQAGVNQVDNGGQVVVAAGDYAEQVTIQKSVKLTGAGAGASTIRAPATLPAATNPDSAIVLVKGAGTNAEISGFSIAGPGSSLCNSILSGIFVRDTANANIHDNSILDIRDQPFGGCQNGLGILVGDDRFGTSGTATIANNHIEGYQKNGIVVRNTGSNATITGNTVKGAGTQTEITQNGIVVGFGGTAVVTGNTVLDNLCNHTICGPDLFAANLSAGILLYSQGAGTVVATNTVSNNDTGVYNYAGAPVTITENLLTANRYAGAYLAAGSATVTANEISGASNVGIALVSVNSDNADAQGTLTNNKISGAGKGVQLLDETPSDSAVPTATLRLNSIAGNTVGVDNSTPAQVDATRNWWGSPTGPSGAGNLGGTGDSMSGNIGFDPWLCDGIDTSAVTGFQPNPDALCGGTAPDTSITSQPANPSSSTTATFAFTGTDDVTPPASLTFECKLDGTAFAACASGKTYTGLANGLHTFQVRARDAAGNADPTPASYAWTVAVTTADTTPPNTTIVSGPPSSSSSATATFTFSGADNMTQQAELTFECKLDGAAFAPCGSPKTYSGLANGSHTFQVRARDAAGNVDSTPATHSWTIKLRRFLYLPMIQR